MARIKASERIAALEREVESLRVAQEGFWHLAKGDKPIATGRIDAGEGRGFCYELFGIDRARGGVVIVREFDGARLVSTDVRTLDDLREGFGRDDGGVRREAWWYNARDLLESFLSVRRASWCAA